MLDMNLTQPGGFVYTHVGTLVMGRRIAPAIIHPPQLYLNTWIKDFVVALVRP